VFLVQLTYVVSVVSRRARRMLDERVADVLNYVDSADRDLPATSALADVAERVEARVAERLREAVAGGAEDVVVVAHSLGSVIAYRTLMRGLADARDEPWGRVSALITIGSPLNTFSLVWPRLVAPVGDAPMPAVAWDNVHDRLDPIAAKIKHVRPFAVPVHEHLVFGRAGFALAHTRYEQQPVFLKVLGERLDAPPANVTVTPFERVGLLARSVLECIGVIVGALVALVVGAAVALAAGALAALVLAAVIVAGTMLKNYSAWLDSGFTFEGAVRGTFAVLMVLAFLVVPLIAGRIRARKRQYAHVHNTRPDLAGVGEDIPDPPAWMMAIAAVAGAVLGVGFTLALWSGSSIPNAWDAGVGPIARALLVLAYAFAGGIGAVGGLWVVGGMTRSWHTWRQWRTATGQSRKPPA
jgi:hypothetical protein